MHVRLYARPPVQPCLRRRPLLRAWPCISEPDPQQVPDLEALGSQGSPAGRGEDRVAKDARVVILRGQDDVVANGTDDEVLAQPRIRS